MACDNNAKCLCTSTSCSRHGKCCECVSHHRSSGGVPGCFFTKEGERTYDRSIENLYKHHTGQSRSRR